MFNAFAFMNVAPRWKKTFEVNRERKLLFRLQNEETFM